MTLSFIIFFKPWICWNSSCDPPWSGWWILNDYRKTFLNSSCLYNLVRFIIWNAEGSWNWKKISGAGSKRVGSIGMKGRKVLTRRSITMFSIIIIQINEWLYIQLLNKILYKLIQWDSLQFNLTKIIIMLIQNLVFSEN